MVDDSVVKAVQRYLRSLNEQGIPVDYGVVFGSHATGRAHQWSDIDLLVVSPRFDEQRQRADVNRLWRAAAHTDCCIEPIPVGARQFLEDEASAVIAIARREGQVVALEDPGQA